MNMARYTHSEFNHVSLLPLENSIGISFAFRGAKSKAAVLH